ncbi:MAG: CapA family protein [Armatimonadota bacterium]
MKNRYFLIALCAVLLAATWIVQAGCQQSGTGAGGTLSAGTAASADEPEIITPPQPKPRFTMVAVGDIMLDRNVAKAIQDNGYRSILEKVRELTRSPDVTFANLECPLSDEGPHAPSKYCIFRAPPETAEVLADGGIDIVSLANNHTLNAGRKGVLNTLDTLEKHGIAYAGCRRDRDNCWEPTYLAAGDYTLGFMACTDLAFEHGSYCKVGDREVFAGRIAEAAEHCDFLFVSVHWGHEYHSEASSSQQNLAHFIIDSGADVVLGHHPHTLQGIEVYKGRPILYSMGNFVFDQREGERMESAIFHLTYIENWGWSIFAKPIWIPRSRMGPIYPETNRAAKIAERLAHLSAQLGTDASVKHNKVWITIPAAHPDIADAAETASKGDSHAQ